MVSRLNFEKKRNLLKKSEIKLSFDTWLKYTFLKGYSIYYLLVKRILEAREMETIEVSENSCNYHFIVLQTS